MTKQATTDPQTSINSNLAQRVLEATGQNVFLCYQCVKCTSGCPLAEFFDWQPNQIMRAVQLGQEDIALESDTPWLCAACQTCSTRCPQDLDINAVMEYLTREAHARGIKPRHPQVEIFNQAFLREVRLWGRAYEPGLMAELTLRHPRPDVLREDLPMYIKMLRKGKVGFLPRPARTPRKAKPVPGAAKAVAYYPGCSLHATAREFNTSAQAVCEALNMTLIEPHNWVCCGSTAAHRSDPETAVRLPLENLTMIEQSGFNEVTMPCAACFNRHKAAQYEHRQGHSANSDYQDSVRVTTLIEAIHNHVGPAIIADKVKRPLAGLHVVTYYGCLLTRPPKVTEAPHPENPTDMDELIAALGAKVVDWSYKTSCCGASHALTRPDIVVKLGTNLLTHAREVGAEAIAVACPLCHMNLDARQYQMEQEPPLPVLYFTQLMALALGLPAKAMALDKNMVDPRPLFRQKGLLGSH